MFKANQYKFGRFLNDSDTGNTPEDQNKKKEDEKPETFTKEQLEAEIKKAKEEVSSASEAQLKKLQDELEELKEKDVKDVSELLEKKRGELATIKAEFNSHKDKIKNFSSLFTSHIDDEVANWPEEVKELIDLTLEPEELLKSFKKLKPMASKLAEQAEDKGRHPSGQHGRRQKDNSVLNTIKINGRYAIPGQDKK